MGKLFVNNTMLHLFRFSCGIDLVILCIAFDYSILVGLKVY